MAVGADRTANRARLACSRALCGVIAGACIGAASAANVSFKLADPQGRVLDGAVVSLLPVGRNALPAPRPAHIEQVNKTFRPLVSVVQVGTVVDFPNHDTVRHHVYSFSSAKVFELKLYTGRAAQPVVFDKPGVVVLGCNIHDRMLAYVVVVETPWSAVAGTDGLATLRDVPPGEYTLQVWHPQRLGKPDLPVRAVRVTADQSESLVVDLKQ
jgi:plastocyanin